MAHWPASWDSMWGHSPFQLSPGYWLEPCHDLRIRRTSS
jgi:hypothetical protein